MDITGFFGTGKYTIFEGADRIEIITKNKRQAYMFKFVVTRDASGNPTAIRLTGIRKVTDSRIAQGVTVRRIKAVNNTIPELDQMLAQRAWRSFAGLAQNENFKIYFIDHEGRRQPLTIKSEVLTSTDFKAPKPGEEQETNFGTMRIISAQDMPLQIIDKAGLRVGEIKEEYLELIPHSLRRHIKELGIIIQIPLPLIRNRSAFEHENEYLPFIQKYIAIEFYKAIAYKTLTQNSPQFAFEGFSYDWETNDDQRYWNEILGDESIMELGNKIDGNRYSKITRKELASLLTEAGKLDKSKEFVKLIYTLKVAISPGKEESLLNRRLAVQEQINKAMAEAMAKRFQNAGKSVAPANIREIPHSQKKIVQAQLIKEGHEQMNQPEKFLVNPKDYTEADQGLIESAFSNARQFGIEQILLVDGVAFAGAFKNYKGKHTMFLHRGIANEIGRANMGRGFIDEGTDGIIHELGHLLERFIHEDDWQQVWKEGYVAHLSGFTHDSVGTFAEAMKYTAAVTLASQSDIVTRTTVAEMANAEGGMVTPNILRGWAEAGEIDKIAVHITRGLLGQNDAVINAHLAIIVNELDKAELEKLKKSIEQLRDKEGDPEKKKAMNDLFEKLILQGQQAREKNTSGGTGEATQAVKDQTITVPVVVRNGAESRTASIILSKEEVLSMQSMKGKLKDIGIDIGDYDLHKIQVNFSARNRDAISLYDLLEGKAEQSVSGIRNIVLPNQFRVHFGKENTHYEKTGQRDIVAFLRGILENENNIWPLLLRINYNDGTNMVFQIKNNPTMKIYSDTGEDKDQGLAVYMVNDLDIKKVDIFQPEPKNSLKVPSELTVENIGWKELSNRPERAEDSYLGTVINNILLNREKFEKAGDKIKVLMVNGDIKVVLRYAFGKNSVIIHDIAARDNNDHKKYKNAGKELVAELLRENNGVEVDVPLIVSPEGKKLFSDLGFEVKEKINAHGESMGVASAKLRDKNTKKKAEDSGINEKGGIDFRALPITAQPMTLAGVGGRITPGTINIANMDLDKEWQEIENMLNAGIKPSLERIREYLVLSCKDANYQAKIDQVLSGLADILRMEEESSFKTETELKAILMLLESNKSAEQMGTELLKISILPLEPMKI